MDFDAFSNRAATAILNADRLDDLFSKLGCDFRWGKSWHRFRGPCPVHGGTKPNLHLGTGYDVPIWWACHSRQCHRVFVPTVLGLVRGVLSRQKYRWSARGDKTAPIGEAVQYLREFVGDLPAGPVVGSRPRPAPRPKSSGWSRVQVRGRLFIPSPYFVRRGFDEGVLEQMDVGHSPKRERSVVPVYDDDGRVCIGYLERSELPVCSTCGKCHQPGVECRYGQLKWRVFPEGIEKGSLLYNYAAARRDSRPRVFVVEGPGDVWRLEEAGATGVACLGNVVTDQQAQKLVALKKRVLVAFDNDVAGQTGALAAYDTLKKVGASVEVVRVPDAYHDVGEMPAAEVAAWVTNFPAPWPTEEWDPDDLLGSPGG